MAPKPQTTAARKKPEVPGQAPKPGPERTVGFKVRAIATGYYDHARRRVGDVFVIADQNAFSEKWMEYVDAQTPERVSTAQQALGEAHTRIRSEAAGVEGANVGADNASAAQGVL